MCGSTDGIHSVLGSLVIVKEQLLINEQGSVVYLISINIINRLNPIQPDRIEFNRIGSDLFG